mgnify:CR=1 FL=1
MNKSIYDKLKIIGIKTLRCGTHLFSFFPIKKGRVLLSSYLGESYSCNPKYISEYLQKNYPEKFEIVWAFKDTNKFDNFFLPCNLYSPSPTHNGQFSVPFQTHYME